MLYDPTNPIQGIKGGTLFSEEDFTLKRRNYSSITTSVKKKPQNQSTSYRVEDRLLDYEKRRLLKIQQQQQDSIANKENCSSQKKQQLTRVNSIKTISSTRAPMRSSILDQCISNYLKKNQKVAQLVLMPVRNLSANILPLNNVEQQGVQMDLEQLSDYFLKIQYNAIIKFENIKYEQEQILILLQNL